MLLVLVNIRFGKYQDDQAKQAEANESGWKVIACRRLGALREELSDETQSTKQGILAVVSIDRHLATLSIVQRYHYEYFNYKSIIHKYYYQNYHFC